MSGRLYWQDRQKHTHTGDLILSIPSFSISSCMFHLKFCIHILNISYHTNTSYFILFNLFFSFGALIDNQQILIESQSRRLWDCHQTLSIFCVYTGREIQCPIGCLCLLSDATATKVSDPFSSSRVKKKLTFPIVYMWKKCWDTTHTVSFAFFVHMLGRCPIKSHQKSHRHITTIII